MELNCRLVLANDPASRRCIDRMMQLYVYDFSDFAAFEIRSDGTFETPDIDSFWARPDHHPFLIHCEGEIAGFALVGGGVTEPDADRSIGQFFVLQSYRRKGIGMTIAHQLFERFPGKWEVHQIESNESAIAFWRRAIGVYTKGNYEEVRIRIRDFECIQQRFRSP